MPMNDLVALACRITSGVFSSELVFEIRLADGTVHQGVASRRYFFTKEGKAIAVHEPVGDQEVDGLVLAQVLRKQGDNILVSIPDGEVVTVDEDLISPCVEDPGRVFV